MISRMLELRPPGVFILRITISARRSLCLDQGLLHVARRRRANGSIDRDRQCKAAILLR